MMRPGEKGKWEYFRQVIEGMEVVLEFVLNELEGEGWENEDEDIEEEEMGIAHNSNITNNSKSTDNNTSAANNSLCTLINNFLK